MPNTAPSQSLALNQRRTLKFKVYSRTNPLELDNSVIAMIATSQPAIATVQPHPTNPRAFVVVAGTQTGSCHVSVDLSPPSPVPLVIPITVTAPVDYSHIDFDGAEDPEPK